MSDITVDAFGTVTLSINTYLLPGYTFSGWNTKEDGSGTAYADGAAVNGADLSGDITLYAQWQPKEYTVTFDQNGGMDGAASQQLRFDEAAALTKNTAVKGLDNFVGWSASDGSLYADEMKVVNLCTIEADGSLTGEHTNRTMGAAGRDNDDFYHRGQQTGQRNGKQTVSCSRWSLLLGLF